MDARGGSGQAPVHLGSALMTRKVRCEICNRKVNLVEWIKHLNMFHPGGFTEKEKKDATDKDD